jgi:hypothetical protein
MHDLTSIVVPSHPAGVTAGASIAATLATVPGIAGGSFTDTFGDTINGTITGLTAHTWIDDATGLFHTTTDLQTEWAGYYQQMIEGHAASLTPTERLEAQAQAVFLDTGLHTLSAATQAEIREDVQREIDVIGAAQQIDQTQFGINPNAPLTAQSYLDIVNTIAANPALRELGVQGHGLNKPPLSRYDGYTIDAQHVTDTATLFVGKGGPDFDDKAVTDFMDDAIMTHMVFPVVERNGQLIQLNQNGSREELLTSAVKAANYTMYGKLLTSSDFSTTPAPR